jgi:uncharacterized protein YifE (UPF0438 family)
MTNEEQHKQFIGKPLAYLFYVDHLLTAAERAVLKKYGAWMAALATGVITPFTPEQERFLKADAEELVAQSSFEKAWVRFKEERKKFLGIPSPSEIPCSLRPTPQVTAADIARSLVVFSKTDGQD